MSIDASACDPASLHPVSDPVAAASEQSGGVTPTVTDASAKPGKSPYRGGAYRADRRRSHHHDAHASQEEETAPETPSAQRHALSHLICRSAPELITTQDALLALLGRLRQAGSFAYDSEFIGEATYTPKLCLVQIATAREVALIDPLSPEIDLAPFWSLLAEESVEKVVHAGQQDIEPVVRYTNDRARSIFDTQLAAGFLAMTYPVALSKLALEVLGARLGKSMTFTQWDARPLTSTQLKYAADDVRYLPALRKVLGDKLAAAGHEARARAEFDALCEPDQYRFDPNTYIHRVRGSGSLTPNQLRILRELVIWRDAAAREADVPPRAYLKDEILVDMSKSPVKTKDKLAKVRGLPRPVEKDHGDAIIAAVLRGQAAPPVPGVETDKLDEPTPTLKFKVDSLWTAAQAICHAQGIDPMLGTSRQEIGKLIYPLATNKQPSPDLRILQGWRKDLIGDPLIQMFQSTLSLNLTWKDGLPRTT
jgi:ribonuclease D